jgi:polyadenylate-binding protein 2
VIEAIMSSSATSDRSSQPAVGAATEDEAVHHAPPSSTSLSSSKQEEEEEEEEDLEKLQAEIARMEEEAARIAKETEELKAKSKSAGDKAAATAATTTDKAATAADGVKRDGLSVYVGQVDYTSTPEELLAHFEACGTVERVTIVCDKFSGRPKGTSHITSVMPAAYFTLLYFHHLCVCRDCLFLYLNLNL